MQRTTPKGRIPDEAKLGVAFLLAVLIFVFGLFFLREIRITSGTYLISVSFDNVAGVKRSDPILLGGVRIGKVESVVLQDRSPVLSLRIEDEYLLPKDSWIEIIDRSIMGEKGLNIRKGTSPEMVQPGGELAGRSASGLFDMVSKADTLSISIRTLLENATRMVDSSTQTSLKGSLENVHEITGTLKTTLDQERQQIHRLIASMSALANNMQEMSASERSKVSNTLTNLEKTSAQLTDMVDGLQKTSASLETILARIERGEGTLGRLIKDDKLYNDMDRMMVNLDGLILDLKQNPKRYVNISIF